MISCATSTYQFTWNSDSPVPHLTGVSNLGRIGTAEAYALTYASSQEEPPFGTDPKYSGISGNARLATMTNTSIAASTYDFTYDSAGASELTEVTFPQPAAICAGITSASSTTGTSAPCARWGRAIWQPIPPGWLNGPIRSPAPTPSNSVTSGTQRDDAGKRRERHRGEDTGAFIQPSGSNAWQVGLASGLHSKSCSSPTGTVYTSDAYTWSQDPAGHPYISAKTSVKDPGTGNQQSALSTQTLDQYGNVTQSTIYPYNNTTAARSKHGTPYVISPIQIICPNYVRNLLSTTVLTTGGNNITVLTNTSYPYSDCYYCGSAVALSEMDPSPPVPLQYRGLPLTSVTPSGRGFLYPSTTWGSGLSGHEFGRDRIGEYRTRPPNYAAPHFDRSRRRATARLSRAMPHQLAIAADHRRQTGEQCHAAIPDDSAGQPPSASSPYGGVVDYSYSTNSQTKSGPGGRHRSVAPMALGRATRMQRIGSGVVQSNTDTVYAPCACSPLGKVRSRSPPQPYARIAEERWPNIGPPTFMTSIRAAPWRYAAARWGQHHRVCLLREPDRRPPIRRQTGNSSSPPTWRAT